MGDLASTSVSGVLARGYQRGSGSGNWDQYVVPVRDRITSWAGRVTTFATPGRAAASQKIFALHNATGSSVLVNVNRVRVDLLTTVAKAATVQPPYIRVHKFTAIPTNGTVITTNKIPFDSAYGTTGSASVTAWGDSSADNAGAGTSSGTTLTVTIGGVLDQVYAPRLIQSSAVAIAYEPVDYAEFFIGSDITLRALEGIVVFLDGATATTGNPTSDKWLVTCDFEEYTRP